MEYQEPEFESPNIATEAIDISQLKEVFQRQKMVTINGFLTTPFAHSMFEYLNQYPAEKWYVSTYPESPKLLRPKNTLNTPTNKAFIHHFQSVAERHFEEGNYAFRFKKSRYVNNTPPEGPELQLKRYLQSRAFFDLLGHVIGSELNEMNGSFASCYEKGDFLARHNDGNNGTVGFVLYLSKDWQPEWGGEIEFMDRDTLEPHFALSPGFNKLLVFSIDQLKHLQHEVKRISDKATGKRFAYSGWFK